MRTETRPQIAAQVGYNPIHHPPKGTPAMTDIDYLNRVRLHASGVRDAQPMDSPIRNLTTMIIDLATIVENMLEPEPEPPAGVHLYPDDRESGAHVAIGQRIEHARLLDACAPDVIVFNGPAEARTYFRRTRQKRGGVPRKWQPCDENGVIRPHAGWPDGFDSDQLFLPATVVKLPTQVIS
ncbi:hypothetical protein SEA_ALI17_74 [Gordonia phage Ali17]|uniref:Uncharacterized protein n=1 Tax=Gordonia phage Ali17 TaxID=2301561 RepID=A0A385DMY0_9CAUD|nr:hypothetical protein J1772_gp74 [Gordonia phage Ali17]AXQ60700.1 hypothetical protein SEA_ALI17_74 [Gordonia phage Ali17]